MNPHEIEKNVQIAKGLLAKSVKTDDENQARNLESAAQVYATIAVAEGLRGLLLKKD